jgi:hypothetical protein
MAFRAKSLSFVEHPAQHRVQRAALGLLRRSKLQSRLDAMANHLTPFVMEQTGLDEKAARKRARRWTLEAVAEAVYMHDGDVIFVEND